MTRAPSAPTPPVLCIGQWELRVALIPSLAALAMFVLLLFLGWWQLDRAEQKRLLLDQHSERGARAPLALSARTWRALVGDGDPRALRYQPVTMTGRFDDEHQYLLDNRTHKGVAGYHVLTPFGLQGDDVLVLVNRGWVPVGPSRERLPDIGIGASVQIAEGVLVTPPAAGLLLGSSGYEATGWPRVVQNLDLSVVERDLAKPLLPLLVAMSPQASGGYVRQWRAFHGISPQRHQGYALQWFSLAVALVMLCIWVAVKRRPEKHHGC